MGTNMKCTIHRETKIEYYLQKDGKEFIDYFCFSCWFDKEYKIELEKYEEKLKKYKSKFFNIFETPPSRPNTYELKRKYQSYAKHGKEGVKIFKEKLRQVYFNKNTPTNFDMILNMKGIDFENFIEVLFKKQGFDVTKTPSTGDGGVDLVVAKKINKRTVRTAVQCKRYKKSVGVSAIQEVFTGKHIYKCSKAIVITTSEFTAPAIKTAQGLKVELWDKFKLIEAINLTLDKNNSITLSFDEYLSQHLIYDVFPF